MVPNKRQQLRSLHEAGHAALALYFGRLGAGEISIIESIEGGGAVPIATEPHHQCDQTAISNRAAICMAGVAADSAIRGPEYQVDFTGSIDWLWMACRFEDLRHDIEKTRVLHVMSENVGLTSDSSAAV